MSDPLELHDRLRRLVSEALPLSDMNGFVQVGIHLDAALVELEKERMSAFIPEPIMH